MTTTFQDNEAVTLAALNNIAIDLGDTTFSAFSEEKFGVDKLNQITQDLVTAGILRTEDDGNSGLEIGCKLSCKNGIVTIGRGIIVFESGAKSYIEEPIEIEVAAGSYVYVLNDILTGKASLQVSSSEPTEGDFVMLARVVSGSSLNDLRMAAKSKVLSTGEGTIRNFEIRVPAHNSAEVFSITIPGGFSCVIVWSYGGYGIRGQNAYYINSGNSVQAPLMNDFKVEFKKVENNLEYRTFQTGGGSTTTGGLLEFSVI